MALHSYGHRGHVIGPHGIRFRVKGMPRRSRPMRYRTRRQAAPTPRGTAAVRNAMRGR